MSHKEILILGSGAVARPCVQYLTRDPKNRITIASRTLSSAQTLVTSLPASSLRAISLDVSSAALSQQIAPYDLVVSLVPSVHHATVIKAAIEGKTHVVTSDYISPEIRGLEKAAKEAGITVLNEVGVSPGVDHLYAIKIIGEVHSNRGKIKEFYSFFGSIPAPECSNNPLRFKSSWSHRSALIPGQLPARILSNGIETTIPPKNVIGLAAPQFVKEGYSLVAFPYGDSVSFRDLYGIPEAETVVRGFLRYEGNPEFLQSLERLGWLSVKDKDWLKPGLTWAHISQKLIGADSERESSLLTRIEEVCSFTDKEQSRRIVSGLRWLGLLSFEQATVVGRRPLDTLCGQLKKLMTYQSGQRDLVLLFNKVVIHWKKGKPETRTLVLELFGDPVPHGSSAMAKSVGVTCGVATQLLLDGVPAFNKPGLLAPYTKAICEPIRKNIEREGIKMTAKGPEKAQEISYRLKPDPPFVGYGPKRFAVPDRYSSIFQSVAPKPQREIFLGIEAKTTDLRRKASDLSAKSVEYGQLHRSASIEFLETRRKLLRMASSSYITLLDGYKAARASNKITEKDFRDLTDGCWNKRAKLADEELTLDRERDRIIAALDAIDRPDFEGAYTTLFTQIFENQEQKAEYEARQNFRMQDEAGKYFTETSWRNGLREYYNARDPEDPDRAWCPITKVYGPASTTRKCAHIVPQRLSSQIVGYMFGEPDQGEEIKWSMRNAMIMDSTLEEGFDRRVFVLLPLETKAGEPSRWQFYLMADDQAHRRFGLLQTTWGDLHKRELEWKNDNRPGNRFLYYHFISTLLRYKRYEKPGWEEKFMNLPTGSVWATPGPYLRKSMLKVLAQAVGDVYELPKGEYWEGTFGEATELPAEREEEMRKEFLVVHEKPNTLEDLFEESVEQAEQS